MTMGTYVGPDQKLAGEKAIVQQIGDGKVKAQFNNTQLGHEFSHAWPEFSEDEFDMDTPVDWGNG